MDVGPHLVARLGARHSRHQQLVVAGVTVTDRSRDGRLHRVRVEGTPRGASPDAPAAGCGRMVGDGLRPCRRAAREQAGDLPYERGLQLDVLLGPPGRLTLPARPPGRLVGQALPLGPRERLVFDQDPLTLVALARSAEADHHRREPGWPSWRGG